MPKYAHLGVISYSIPFSSKLFRKKSLGVESPFEPFIQLQVEHGLIYCSQNDETSLSRHLSWEELDAHPHQDLGIRNQSCNLITLPTLTFQRSNLTGLEILDFCLTPEQSRQFIWLVVTVNNWLRTVDEIMKNLMRLCRIVRKICKMLS